MLARADGLVLLAWIALTAIGVAAVYSCTQVFPGSAEGVRSAVNVSTFYHQVMWVGLGMTVAMVCFLIPFRLFETFAFVIYGVALLALVAVFLVGPERAGTHRWLAIGPLSIQPSELAKIAVIFALARFLAVRRSRGQMFTVIGGLLIALPPFLLVLKEPDLGTSLVFLALGAPMLFYSGVRLRFLLALASPLLSAVIMFYGQQVLGSVWPWAIYIIVLLAMLFFSRLYMFQSLGLVAANLATGLGIPLVWERLKSYQQDRILAFFSPDEMNRLGSGYQVFQSKVAIGSGGLLGKGYLQGSQKGLAFLPERHTDFIFSVVGEELGLMGALLVLSLFFLLIYRALRIAVTVKRPFGSLLAVGVATYFAFQSLVNIAITVGLLPVTGLPLPLFTYGGSSMLASCVMVGLLLNVSARWSEV